MTPLAEERRLVTLGAVTRVLAALAIVVAIAPGCVEMGDEHVADELADFSTTTAAAPDAPYEVFLRIAEQNGADLLEPAQVEERASLLCARSGLIEDPSGQGDWSVTDRAIVRAYCPEVEVGP